MSLIKSITGEATNGVHTEAIQSIWSYAPEDPWAVKAHFPDQEITWAFPLDLMMEAFTSPPGRLHGLGDLQIELEGDFIFFHLGNQHSTATLKFKAEKISSFLDQIDDQDIDEVVSQELEEFLEAL